MRADPTKPRETPAMTPGRGALVMLMHRYLGGLMDPFVTLLEGHCAVAHRATVCAHGIVSKASGRLRDPDPSRLV